MTKHEIEKIIKQTPCICGDVETWHEGCYQGEITKEMIDKSWKIAKRKIRHRAKLSTVLLIGLAKEIEEGTKK